MRSPRYDAAVSRAQSPAEEVANVITHGIGAVLACAIAAIMIVHASLHGDAVRIVTLSIFSATLIAMYLSSTIYHGMHPTRRPRWRRAMHTTDHIAIYLLIAGTYTPFMLVTLGGAWGWSVFGVVWGLAAAGTVFKLFATGRWNLLSTLMYVAMGWLVLIAGVELWRSMSGPGLAWLLAGGLVYTLGAVVYSLRRIRYHHAAWHLMVIAGSACHVVAMWHDVL